MGAFARGFVQMSFEGLARGAQAIASGLRTDGLPQGGDPLAQQAPASESGQAAARRGESSNASVSGSSTRIIERRAGTRALAERSSGAGGSGREYRRAARLAAPAR